MKVIEFRAVLDDVHYSPNKNTTKIRLVIVSQIDLNDLATIAAQDDSFKVVFKTAQTEISPVYMTSASVDEKSEGDI